MTDETDEPTTPGSAPSRLRRAARLFAYAVAGLLVLLLVGFLFARPRPAAIATEWAAACQDLSSACCGCLPPDATEADKKAAAEAAEAWLRVGKLLRTWRTDGLDEVVALVHPDPAPTPLPATRTATLIAALERIEARSKAPLDALRRAAALKAKPCWPLKPRSEGPAMELEDDAQSAIFVMALSVSDLTNEAATLAAFRGDGDAIVEMMDLSLRSLNGLNTMPCDWMSDLPWQQALRAHNKLRTIAVWIGRFPFNDAQLQRLDRSAAALDLRTHPARAVADLRARSLGFFLPLFWRLDSWMQEDPHRGGRVPCPIGSGEADAAATQQLFAELTAIAQLPVERAVERLDGLPTPNLKPPELSWQSCRLIYTTSLKREVRLVMRRTYRSITAAIARQRVLRVGIAVERFRLAQHRLPKTLDELTPTYVAKLPVDPYGGGPLRYRRTPKGYRVYSIGTPRCKRLVGHKDNGGRVSSEASGDDCGADIAFVMEPRLGWPRWPSKRPPAPGASEAPLP